MKDQLIKYVDLLFAGAPNAQEIKQEILQNTLDRYDDLLAQGKSPQAAYSLSIAGIGDVSELLRPVSNPGAVYEASQASTAPSDPQRTKTRAIAIGLYIVSAIPLFILTEFNLETLGLCLTILLVAAATVLIIMTGKDPAADELDDPVARPQAGDPTREQIRKIIKYVTIISYFITSIVTGAWLVTWLIFPLSRCVSGLIFACLELKEAN